MTVPSGASKSKAWTYNSLALVVEGGLGRLEAREHLVGLEVAREAAPPELHGQVPLLVGHGLRDGLGLLHAAHERQPHGLVAVQRHHAGLRAAVHLHERHDGLRAHATAQDAVEGRRRASALHVAQHGDARVLLQVVHHDRADLLRRDGPALAVDRALGHDDYVQPLPRVTLLNTKLIYRFHYR